MNRYFDKKKGRAMSVATLGNSLAPMLFATIVTFLVEIYAYPGAMLVMAGLALNSLPACALYRPLPEPKITLTNVIQKSIEPSECENEEKNHIKISDASENEPPSDHSSGFSERHKDGNECYVKVSDNSENKLLSGVREAENTKFYEIYLHKKRCLRIFDCFRQFRYMSDFTFSIYGFTMSAMTINNGCIYVFLPSLCFSKGFTQPKVALMFILCGISDCVGRFLAGALYDVKVFKPNRVWTQGVIGVLLGVFTIIIPLMTSHWSVILAVCLRSVAIGGFNGQRMTILADIVGSHKMAACVGLVFWFQGIGSSFGIFLAGKYLFLKKIIVRFMFFPEITWLLKTVIS